MNIDTVLVSLLIIIIIVSESVAQNFIKKGSDLSDGKYLFISIFLYGIISILLYKLYKFNKMGPVFILWSILSTLSIYLVGYFFYDELITIYDIIGFILCSIGLYIIFNGN